MDRARAQAEADHHHALDDAGLGFGLTLAYMIGAWTQGWFLAKFAVVVALSGYHGWLIDYGRKLEQGARLVSGRTLRIMNEIPGVATRSSSCW